MALPTPTDSTPALGQPISEVETPAVVVDLDVMENNMAEYAAYAREAGVALRSHTKTHKIPEIAHRQQELTGGDGIICQTLSEVEVMAAGGIDDIYLSYFVVEDGKLDRLCWLSEKLDQFATTVDGPGNIDPLQRAAARNDVTIDVILEIDIGLERVGVAPGEPTVEMAQYLADQPNLSMAGVMAYEGHLAYSGEANENTDAFERRCLETMDKVAETVSQIEAAGIAVPEVKVGSTATSPYSAKHDIVTEVNPGMYPFMDARLAAAAPHITMEDCALVVESTVISSPTDDRVVVDAGSKSISLETDAPPVERDDHAVGYYNASEEHGWIDVSETAASYAVGDRLSFIPPHVCPTINLYDTL
ncbi:MAG: alanine racemase, partial [Halobacteriales archaeon]|nr:alanine racemase [Halobacteriales archaeon]